MLSLSHYSQLQCLALRLVLSSPARYTAIDPWQNETDVISTLTGFSLNNVLSGLDLPTGPGLSNQLGISGVAGFTANQIYNDKWETDPDAVGPGEGEDWEDEVDRELEAEDSDEEGPVKMEAESPPQVGPKEKRTRIVRRLVERPKTVYERFPTFEKNKILNFTELFKGYTTHRSRVSKRPFQGTSIGHESTLYMLNHSQSRQSFRERRRCREGSSQPLSAIQNDKSKVRGWRRSSRPEMLRQTYGKRCRCVL